jgi:hypothetical protein
MLKRSQRQKQLILGWFCHRLRSAVLNRVVKCPMSQIIIILFFCYPQKTIEMKFCQISSTLTSLPGACIPYRQCLLLKQHNTFKLENKYNISAKIILYYSTSHKIGIASTRQFIPDCFGLYSVSCLITNARHWSLHLRV